MKFLLKILLSGLAVLIAAYLLPGVTVRSFGTALLVAGLISIFNVTIKPVLIVLTIPVTILTLGLFLLVINAAIVLLANALIPGFHVDGFFYAVLFSLLLSLFVYIFEMVF
jgi:putative membrane protein